MRRIAVITALALALFAGPCPPMRRWRSRTSGSTAQRPDSRLKTVTKRVIFSTADSESRPDRVVRVRNIGTATLDVSSMTIVGTNASRFAVEDADAADGFTLTPGQFRDVPLSFTPAPGAFGRYAAQLETDSNDPGSPTTVTTLKGLHAIGYEEANEPTLFAALSTLGFEPAGLPQTNLNPEHRLRGRGPHRLLPAVEAPRAGGAHPDGPLQHRDPRQLLRRGLVRGPQPA